MKTFRLQTRESVYVRIAITQIANAVEEILVNVGEEETPMKKWTEKELIESGYTIQNAEITAVDLSTESYCCADLPITLNGNGWGVVYGGYVLGKGGTSYKIDEIEGSAQGMAAILTIMRVVGVDRLNDMKGKYVRVATKGWGDTVKIIGNIIKDEWFDYGTFFEKEKEE